MNTITPTEAADILTRLRWESSGDLISYVLTDGAYNYDNATDRGEMAQKMTELRAVLEGIAAQSQPRKAA